MENNGFTHGFIGITGTDGDGNDIIHYFRDEGSAEKWSFEYYPCMVPNGADYWEGYSN